MDRIVNLPAVAHVRRPNAALTFEAQGALAFISLGPKLGGRPMSIKETLPLTLRVRAGHEASIDLSDAIRGRQ